MSIHINTNHNGTGYRSIYMDPNSDNNPETTTPSMTDWEENNDPDVLEDDPNDWENYRSYSLDFAYEAAGTLPKDFFLSWGPDPSRYSSELVKGTGEVCISGSKIPLGGTLGTLEILPPEIRSKIYEYAMDDHPEEFRVSPACRKVKVKSLKSPYSMVVNVLPAAFLSSEKLLNEGAQAYLRLTLFTFKDNYGIDQFMKFLQNFPVDHFAVHVRRLHFNTTNQTWIMDKQKMSNLALACPGLREISVSIWDYEVVDFAGNRSHFYRSGELELCFAKCDRHFQFTKFLDHPTLKVFKLDCYPSHQRGPWFFGNTYVTNFVLQGLKDAAAERGKSIAIVKA
ncbi:hypothetical protein P280DRAFT_524482 [Massarina eburnea CBS 473.64]|uniref:Uncharacterized protein n=1 Tax=Massarina eburnea CBS 473.64 TaxID=1395130 RepID=A0A6A6RJB3_9PLEO|nr:hypothetical protein P280DRAFT_524482 [Massarina eburnea CBS 473.64]